MSRRPTQLEALVRLLDTRYRVTQILALGARIATVSLALSLALTVTNIGFGLDLPLVRLVAVIAGTALLLTLLLAAVQRVEPTGLLIAADRRYSTHALLVSAYQFEQSPGKPLPASDDELAFQQAVCRRADAFVAEVEPDQVYPLEIPGQAASAAGLAVALLIAVVLSVSGWFDSEQPAVVARGVELQDAGRRLAERADANEVLQDLARQMQELGDRLTQSRIDPEEARERIEELSSRIEEQIRSIERTRPFEQSEDVVIPPETEEAIRSALQRGMGAQEVQELFTRMRSEGNTVPEMVEALEEATPDRAPDTNLGLEREQVQELMDQLNRPAPSEEAESDIVNDLRESRRVVEQTGEGLAEVTQGEEMPAGPRGDSGISQGGDENQDERSAQERNQSDQDAQGQQGGDMAIADERGDDFSRIEESSPVFRELQGIVTDSTIMDVIIRELPSEATSGLSEQERDVVFERVIEQAISREGTPPELQRLVRNYFLRVTRVAEEERNEQQ